MSNISMTEVTKSGELVKKYVNETGLSAIADKLNIGEPTLIDMLDDLCKPGRDPREDLPKPLLRSDVLSIEDLEIGTVLKGTIRSVVDFGAFVDVGLKNDGLVHISQISDEFIKHPLDILNVGDIVEVKVIEINKDKNRISLSMKK